VLIADPEDSRLGNRSAAHTEGGVSSLLVVPILDRGALVGVVEAINKLDGTPFDDDDLFALCNVTRPLPPRYTTPACPVSQRQSGNPRNAGHRQPRITSTLNLMPCLQTSFNAPQAVIPYERAAIAWNGAADSSSVR